MASSAIAASAAITAANAANMNSGGNIEMGPIGCLFIVLMILSLFVCVFSVGLSCLAIQFNNWSIDDKCMKVSILSLMAALVFMVPWVICVIMGW